MWQRNARPSCTTALLASASSSALSAFRSAQIAQLIFIATNGLFLDTSSVNDTVDQLQAGIFTGSGGAS